MPDTSINYTDQLGMLYQLPEEGQTLTVQTPDEIEQEGYYISTRNLKNLNEVPIDRSKVYLNFIAKKVFVSDDMLNQIDDPTFIFYADEVVPDEEPFFLPDGMLYRCLGEPLKDLRDYKYYVMENGVSKLIPDWQSVEVELAKRGVSYSTVQVLTEKQCNDLSGGVPPQPAPSQAGSWSEALGNTTGYNTLTSLSENLATLEGIASGLAASAAAATEQVATDLEAQASGMAAEEAAAAASSAAADSSAAAGNAAASSAAAAASAAAASATQAAAAATATQAAADTALAQTIAAQIALENAQSGG